MKRLSGRNFTIMNITKKQLIELLVPDYDELVESMIEEPKILFDGDQFFIYSKSFDREIPYDSISVSQEEDKICLDLDAKYFWEIKFTITDGNFEKDKEYDIFELLFPGA